jgi:ubiquinone/menaquinone biosynthesis C-methylase UbiE
MASYPLIFNLEEIDRLTAQSSNLADDILPLMGQQAKTCLEIGCGVGSNVPTVSKYNAALKYTGVDISETAINHAIKKYGSNNTEFRLQEGSSLKFPDNHFDLVFIRLVLWGTSNREQILKEAFRVLKPNGVIYCFEPDDKFLINHPPKENFEKLIGEWQKRVLEAGCDPFIGRKLQSYLLKTGFKIISNQVKLSVYDSINPKDFLTATKNLSRIFLSNGPTFFGLTEESKAWVDANLEIETVEEGATLTEGYFILIAKKNGGQI